MRCIGRARVIERRLHRHHHFVVVAVIAAFNLDDLFAAGRGAGDAQCIHRGFGTRVREAPERKPVASRQQFGHLGVARARGYEEGAVVKLSRNSLAHRRVHMACKQGPEAHVVVDIAIAVDVDRPVLLRAGKHDRIRVVILKT